MKFPKAILVLLFFLCSCATPRSLAKFEPLEPEKDTKIEKPIETSPEETTKIKTIEKKVIAIMKFENLSKNPKFDWLCEGIASTLVTKLGNVKEIRLVERSQVVKSLQEINFNLSGAVDEETAVSAGKILGAEIIIIGEFQRSADQMRITARFVDVATGNIINTAEATGSYNDIFSLQDEIAFNLLKTLGIEVKAEEQKKIQEKPTESLTAYEWVQKAINLSKEKEEKINKEDLDLMIKYCKKALEIDPNFVDAHLNLGWVYYKKGLYDRAIEELKEAIRLNPDDAQAHYNLGTAYGKKGLYDQAIEEFKEAIRINPDLAEAHCNLGIAYSEKGLYDQAIKEYKEAIRLNPDLAEVHLNLGVAYGEKGLYDKAIEEFKEVIRIDPDLAEAHYNLGLAYTKKGLYDEAIEEYKEAIRLNPDFSLAHLGLGVVYGEKGLHDKAIEEYKEAIRINPYCAEAHYFLGSANLSLGRKGDALDEYNILKELDKNFANQLFNLIYK